MSLKPRLGDIATPGRVCSPHNEIYDCRIHPNGIGCLRRRSTRRRLGCRPAARPAGQEPAFRADPTSERNDLPVRNARFPIRASRTLRRLAYSGYAAGKRERKERERDEVPPGAVSVRRRTTPPGDRTGNAVGERAERPQVRERGKLVRPVSGLRKIGPSRQKCRTNPEYLSNTLLHQNPKYKRGVHSYESYRNSARGLRPPRALFR